MPMFTPRQSGKTCFAASCRELQASGLCSPETVRHNDCYFVRHAKRNAIASAENNRSRHLFPLRALQHVARSQSRRAGMSLRCQDCSKLTAVPKPSEPAAGDLARLQGIQRRLTENESQRSEATSYINQLNIQLHRWQLRLQTLNERKQQLEK